MRMTKLLGLAFCATLAFSAVGAFGAGSASALLFLTESGKELLFTIKSLGAAIVEDANGTKVECRSALGHGFIINKSDEARKILMTSHECTSSGFACTSSGEPSGSVKTLELDALLVTLLSPLDKYGLKLLPESGNFAEFTCGGIISVEARGTIVGEFEETLSESETFKREAKLAFEKGAGAGVPFIKDYWTLHGVATAKLELNVGVGFVEMNLEALRDVIPNGGVKFCHN